MAIILRSSKSTPLTFEELDGNFTDLNQRLSLVEDGTLNITTDQITEGSNLFYTNARARASISVTDSGGDGSLSYNSSTGVITYTGPSASEVRSKISVTDSGGDGSLSYNSSTGVITYTGPDNAEFLARLNTSSIDELSDVALSSPANGEGLVYNSVSGQFENAVLPGASGGEANTASNVGGFAGVFQTKVGVDLRFRTLQSSNSSLSFTENTNDVDIVLGNTLNTNTINLTANGVITFEGGTDNNFETTLNVVDPTADRTVSIPNVSGTVITTGNLSDITSISGVATATFESLTVDNINLNQNIISTTSSNIDLTISPNGSGAMIVNSDVLPGTDSTHNLGASGNEWSVVHADTIQATSLVGLIQDAAQTNITSVGVLSSNLQLGAGIDVVFEGSTANAFETTLTVVDPGADRTVTIPDTTGTIITTGNLTDITNTGTLGSLTVTNQITADSLSTNQIDINQNVISSNASNLNIVLDPAGTGLVVAPSGYDMSTGSALAFATKAYVDSTSSSASSLSIAGDSGTDTVIVGTNTLTFAGTVNEVVTTVTDNTVTLSLPATINANTTGNAATSTATSSVTATTSTAASNFKVPFLNTTISTNGDYAVLQESTATFTYNPSTNTLVATNFSGTASSAQYADLAEKYLPDVEYTVGTVMQVGGEHEVTACSESAIPVGVVSDKPAYLMNSELVGGVALALVGRVPVRVLGKIYKGEPVYVYNNGLASKTGTGQLVGIALETNEDQNEKLVECVLKV